MYQSCCGAISTSHKPRTLTIPCQDQHHIRASRKTCFVSRHLATRHPKNVLMHRPIYSAVSSLQVCVWPWVKGSNWLFFQQRIFRASHRQQASLRYHQFYIVRFPINGSVKFQIASCGVDSHPDLPFKTIKATFPFTLRHSLGWPSASHLVTRAGQGEAARRSWAERQDAADAQLCAALQCSDTLPKRQGTFLTHVESFKSKT